MVSVYVVTEVVVCPTVDQADICARGDQLEVPFTLLSMLKLSTKLELNDHLSGVPEDDGVPLRDKFVGVLSVIAGAVTD